MTQLPLEAYRIDMKLYEIFDIADEISKIIGYKIQVDNIKEDFAA